jgi:uncharacterized protein with GYD domain
MPKHLFQVSYTPEGAKGLLKEGGSARYEYLKGLVEKLGGKLEAMYWAFGDTDLFIITDSPSNEATAALSLVVTASGSMRVKTVQLLTPEQIDEAAKQAVPFRAPGT